MIPDADDFLVLRRRGYTALSIRNFAIVLVWPKSEQYGFLMSVMWNTLFPWRFGCQLQIAHGCAESDQSLPWPTTLKGKKKSSRWGITRKMQEAALAKCHLVKSYHWTPADFAEVPPRKWKRLTLEGAVSSSRWLCHYLWMKQLKMTRVTYRIRLPLWWEHIGVEPWRPKAKRCDSLGKARSMLWMLPLIFTIACLWMKIAPMQTMTLKPSGFH